MNYEVVKMNANERMKEWIKNPSSNNTGSAVPELLYWKLIVIDTMSCNNSLQQKIFTVTLCNIEIMM